MSNTLSGPHRVLVGAMRLYPVTAIRSIETLRKELSFPNPAYRSAVEQGRTPPPGTPAFLQAFLEQDGYIFVPRHYRPGLLGAVQEVPGYRVNRTDNVGFRPTSNPNGDLQTRAIEWLLGPGPNLDRRLMLKSGTGKTVVALLAAARAKISPVLIVVHEQATMQQWVDRIAQHTDLPAHRVGIIQGERFDYTGCPIAVAMMHTLALRWEHPEQQKRIEALQRWIESGLVILDELDVFPAAKMSRCLGMFAATRWGLTATYRHDGLQPILSLHLGPKEFREGEYDLKPKIVIMKVRCGDYLNLYQNYTNLITQLETRDQDYTGALRRTCTEAMERGRKTLLLLQRTEAIESFGAWGKQQGWSTGIIHGAVGKQERLEQLRECRLVVANRKIAGRALDVPDLECVIAEPTSNPAFIEQIVGRTLRRHSEKARPVVIIVYTGGAGKAVRMMQGAAASAERSLRKIGFDDFAYVNR